MHFLKAIQDLALAKWKVPIRLWMLYGIIYFICGIVMNTVGTFLEIARFTHWWQVLTVYVGYMVPISLLLRGMPLLRQYAYGLIAMGLLEFSGYALESSYAYSDNVLDQLFGIRNFSLAMTLFFAWYFPLGNTLVYWIYRKLYVS
jgi:hypothetical protein